jgi:class 3 adenylate cyclase
MNAAKKKTLSKVAFGCALIAIIAVASLYLYNLINWGELPDYGYGFRTATGVRVIGVVMDVGRKAGLEVGDRIITVNGKTVKNYKEMHAARHKKTGETNTYLIERNEKQFEVVIANSPIGLKEAFRRGGLSYLVGIAHLLIGTLVFLMKPHYRTSWIFLIYSYVTGIFFMFLYKVGIMSPFGLENVNIFGYTFIPAVFVHLALGFPEERKFLEKHPWAQLLPYIASALLFLFIRFLVPTMMDAPKVLFTTCVVYFLVGMLIFLGSCLQLWLRSSSEIVKVRAKMILLAVGIYLSLPVLDLVSNTLFKVYILPGFNYYLPFFIIFPLFVGYSIVKYDLFDIDAVIKRTYGYVLTTAGIAGAYALFVSISNVAFGRFEFTKSPVFPFIFILAVVFFFNPIRNRIQKFIDRIFYRLEYDYHETVQKISETMRSLLSLDEIGKGMMDTALGTMFIDSGYIMLLNPADQVYVPLSAGAKRKDDLNVTKSSYNDGVEIPPNLPARDSLVQKIAEKKKEVTIYDIQEDPFYEEDRDACRKTFDQLGATLLIPLIYENGLTGLMSLGSKKSGKFYRREDINLLTTLANQGAVAIQNARLVDQMKAEEDLRANLARYLSPQIVDQVIKKNVQVNLGGDRKVVTVLFSDIRNFTRISESLPPDKLVQLLNEYFTEMAKIIFENQGSLDKYIGDAIVAVFGSLIPLENSGQTAVLAAVQMMKEMLSLNERWKNQYGFRMDIGIGINTGEVFLGNIGSPERMEFTVIGDTVNIASRFSGLAKPKQILITKETLASLGSDIKHVELPPVAVKGKTDQLEVFEVVY